MPKETTDRFVPTEATLQRAAQFLRDEQEGKARWVAAQQARMPLYPPTNETGALKGFISWLTPTGVRVDSYFETPSGRQFRQAPDRQTGELRTIDLDVEQITCEQTAKLYSVGAFLADSTSHSVSR